MKLNQIIESKVHNSVGEQHLEQIQIKKTFIYGSRKRSGWSYKKYFSSIKSSQKGVSGDLKGDQTDYRLQHHHHIYALIVCLDV